MNEFFILVYDSIDNCSPGILRVREGYPASKLVPHPDSPISLEVNECALGEENPTICTLRDPVIGPSCDDLKREKLVGDRVVAGAVRHPALGPRTLLIAENVELVVLLKHLGGE